MTLGYDDIDSNVQELVCSVLALLEFDYNKLDVIKKLELYYAMKVLDDDIFEEVEDARRESYHDGYLDGKDYTTGHAARIDAVSEADIRKILGLLETGSKIEYIINSK